MQAVNAIAGKPFEQPVLDHAPGAGPALFGRLKDEMHRAGKAAILRQMPGGTEQNRRVAVMPTCVHLAVDRRFLRPLGGFRHGQHVHVGPQPDRTTAVTAGQRSNNTRSAQSAMDDETGCF